MFLQTAIKELNLKFKIKENPHSSNPPTQASDSRKA